MSLQKQGMLPQQWHLQLQTCLLMQKLKDLLKELIVSTILKMKIVWVEVLIQIFLPRRLQETTLLKIW